MKLKVKLKKLHRVLLASSATRGLYHLVSSVASFGWRMDLLIRLFLVGYFIDILCIFIICKYIVQFSRPVDME